jgi:hypothetical protein
LLSSIADANGYDGRRAERQVGVPAAILIRSVYGIETRDFGTPPLWY